MVVKWSESEADHFHWALRLRIFGAGAVYAGMLGNTGTAETKQPWFLT